MSAQTITFDASADKGTCDANNHGADQVTKDGVTIAVSDGAMMLSDQYRCYKSATFTVTSTAGNIQKVEITCAAAGTDKYGPGNFTDATAGTYAFDGNVGTWTGDAATFTMTASGAQVRINTVVVTLAGGNGGASGTIFSWEGGKDGATVTGGTATFEMGDEGENRVNYKNSANGVDYYTLCLSGGKANIDDETYTKNKSPRIKITLDKALAGGETITVTAYTNKGDESKLATPYFKFDNGTELVDDSKTYIDLGIEGNTEPATQTYTVPAEAAGCTSFKMTRSMASTNLFITNFVITGAGGSNAGSNAKGIELSWDTMLKNETGDNTADQSEIKFLDENGNETGFILKPAGGRTQAQTIREYCGKVLNFKNNTNQTLVIPNGTKVYKINFYGWSQGDNWTYLAAYGPSTEWEFEDKNISNQNDDIIANAKYPLDPCVISDSYHENANYPTQYPNGDRVYHNAGYCFASIDFSDEPYEGEFWFKFGGNNQERAWMVIYTTKEDAAAAPAAEAVTLGKDKSQTIFIDAAAAGIEGVKAVKSEGNNAIYNLSGQKVGAGYKGLVIKNGKKYVMK